METGLAVSQLAPVRRSAAIQVYRCTVLVTIWGVFCSSAKLSPELMPNVKECSAYLGIVSWRLFMVLEEPELIYSILQ